MPETKPMIDSTTLRIFIKFIGASIISPWHPHVGLNGSYICLLTAVDYQFEAITISKTNKAYQSIMWDALLQEGDLAPDHLPKMPHFNRNSSIYLDEKNSNFVFAKFAI
jgi:hypothetical protein